MRAVSVTAADGYAWTVRATRVRFPRWRPVSDLVDVDDAINELDVVNIVIYVAALPFTHLLIPLLTLVAQLPAALIHACTSDDAWVEASTRYPHLETYVWRTSRNDAPTVQARVAAQLAAGESLRPERAELVERTSPPTE
jgi:hypothetical protein